MAGATRDLRLPPQPQGITAPWPVTNYTAWWQRRACINNLPKVVTSQRNGRESKPRPFESHVQRCNHYATRQVVSVSFDVMCCDVERKTWFDWASTTVERETASVSLTGLYQRPADITTTAPTDCSGSVPLSQCLSSSSSSSSSLHCRWGLSRHCTTQSTVDSTPPEVSNGMAGIVVAGRATCSVDYQVGDATYGQVGWVMCLGLHSHYNVIKKQQTKNHKYWEQQCQKYSGIA